MTRTTRGLILGVLTLAVFLGVGYYDADQRATRLQRAADDTLQLCESLAARSGGSADQCILEFRRAIDASSGEAFMAAVPTALAAAAVFFVLAYGVVYVLWRRRSDPGSGA